MEIDVNKYTIPSGIVFPMLKVAAILGLPIETLCQEFQLDLQEIMDKEELSIAQFELLMELLIASSPQRDFHIHFAQEFTFGHIEGLETLIFSSEKGLDAVEEVFSYKELFMPFFDVRVDLQQEYGLISYASNTDHPISDKYYYAEIVFVLIVIFGHKILKQQELVSRIAFRHKKTPYYAAMEELFACPISYEAEVDIAWVRKEVLEKPFDSQQRVLHDNSKQLLESRLKAIKKNTSMTYRVEQILFHNLNNKLSCVEHISEQLCMSPRKLQRKLKEENISFTQLKKSVQMYKAKALLIKTDRTIDDISESIGFNNASSFTRFFIQYEGLSPSAYRKQQKNT